MSKHKSEDYKIIAVKYYLENDTNYTKIKRLFVLTQEKSDILYCVDNYNKDANKFRYTQDSRRKECKIKKYAKNNFGI